MNKKLQHTKIQPNIGHNNPRANSILAQQSSALVLSPFQKAFPTNSTTQPLANHKHTITRHPQTHSFTPNPELDFSWQTSPFLPAGKQHFQAPAQLPKNNNKNNPKTVISKNIPKKRISSFTPSTSFKITLPPSLIHTLSNRPYRSTSLNAPSIRTNPLDATPKPTHSTPSTPHPTLITTTKRTFLNAMFEKQRRLSWVMHRRKKMEMSADMLSRPTHRPNRTESMDLIQKKIHDITLGDRGNLLDGMALTEIKNKHDRAFKQQLIDRADGRAFDHSTHTQNRDDVTVDLDGLTLKQKLHIFILKAQTSTPWLFMVYGGMWFMQYTYLIYLFNHDHSSIQRYMDMLDQTGFQSLHDVIDGSPKLVKPLLAWGATSATDLVRFPALLFLTSLYFTKRETIMVEEGAEYDFAHPDADNGLTIIQQIDRDKKMGKIVDYEYYREKEKRQLQRISDAKNGIIREKKMYKKVRRTITLPIEAYQKVRYRYNIEAPPPVEFSIDDIDPNLSTNLVNLPGTDPIPRGDYYGRDRQRDLIPKDRIDLEFVLHSWQRTNAVRRRREAVKRRRKPKKRKIAGPRWAKVGQGMFTRS
jgi:predicted transcriptional regulator